MVGKPPRAALDPTAQLSPSERMHAIAVRSDNPVKRTIDVMCVILLQLLILMVLVDEKDLEKRRGCYVLAPDSILTRLEQGFDFGLPAPLVASIRLAVRLLRAQYNLGQDYIDWLTAPAAPAPIRQPKPRRRSRRPSPTLRYPIPRAAHRPRPARVRLGHHPPAQWPARVQNGPGDHPLPHAHFVANT